ncbi:hypothetical protein EPN29_00795 [bacterium]|nr:MAG: hypothetical protein EPN29_00795 [bacterium]
MGASIGVSVAPAALAAFPALGAGLVEIGPVSTASFQELATALRSAMVPVALRLRAADAVELVRQVTTEAAMLVCDVSGPPDLDVLDQAAAISSVPLLAGVAGSQLALIPAGIGVVLRESTPQDVERAHAPGRTVIAATSEASPGEVADLVSSGADAVLATTKALIEAGPGWFSRATTELLARTAAPRPIERGSTAWIAGLALGLGMIFGGVGAALESLGPVLLPYDSTFLGVDAHGLAAINPRLIHFLQHDRITLAGTMIAIGLLYGCLSWCGIRRGLAWARDALLASGLVGFPTLLYFVAYRYVEPIHVALAAMLFPLFVIAVWKRPRPQLPDPISEGPTGEWHRALVGQLLMVGAGFGLIVGGLTISYVGLTSVFVPTDLTYMSTTAQALNEANNRLLSFIAHDRAGFGGALMSAGVAVLLMAAWGWQRGQAWVWWGLAASATSGFGAALGVHLALAYTDFWHVAPIYAGILVSVLSLTLGRSFLLTRRGAS